MVAIFTGNGLGVFNSSVTQLGQSGGGRLGQSRETWGVNAATGNLVLQALDESILNRGMSATALRTYNSRGQVSGAGQDGWVTGYERWIELDGELNAAGSAVRYHNGDGEQIVYRFDATRGLYVSTAGDGAHDVIMWDESGWIRGRDGHWGNQEYFESDEYRQSGEFDPHPRALLRSFSQFSMGYNVNYDASGRVSEVVSSVGYPNGDAILYSYVGNTTQLASIATRESGVVRTQVSYGYDGVGRLSWVQTDLTPDNAADNVWSANATDNDGRLFRTQYAYVTGSASDLRIASVTTSDGASVSYTYETDGAGGWRVKTVTEGAAVDGSARTVTFVYRSGETDVVDAAGRTWTYRYDADRQLIAMLAPAVNGQRQMTSYEYDAAGNVTRLTTRSFDTATGATGVGIEEQRFRYDSRGNRIQQRDLLGNVVAWTYNQANQVASETRYTVADVDGLDADEAGNWSSPSGALITRFVYEHDWSDRLRFVINAEGEVTERVYTSAAPYYDYLLSSERRYLGERYTGSTFTLQSLNTWASDAAAQRKANSSLTTYAYDAKGRLQRSIQYATVAATVNGDGVLDAGATITWYSHDAQGLLRQSVVSRGEGRASNGALAGSEVTDYVYDGMGRLLGVVRRDAATTDGNDAQTLQTTYSYIDSSNRIQVTQDTGLIRVEARNRAGELLSVSETGMVSGASTTRSVRNYYDNTGRLRASEDAAGGRSYFFYDEAGRLVATVDATGAVARSEYDAGGRIVRTTRHAVALNTQGWVVADAVSMRELVFAPTLPATLAADQAWVAQTAADRVAEMRYDTAGRLILASDNAGSETSYVYDGAGRLVSTTTWGDWIYTGGGWGDAPSMKMARPPTMVREARTTRMFYDGADRLVATLDAEGYLSESVYDAGGRPVKVIRYATVTNSAYRASGTLAQLRPVAATADQVTRMFHDARGRQIGLLDAEGYLSESTYDEQNNQRASRAYARQLTGLTGLESLATLRAAALSGAPVEAYRETRNSYNGLGQLVTTLDHEGVVTRYHYDESGRLVKTEMAAGTSEVRANGQRFDVFGNLIGELDGDGAALLQANMGEAQLDALYAQYGVRHRYDALGRRIETEDRLGHKTWTIHDTAGNRKFVVRGVEDAAGVDNARGEVTEVRYNAFGEAIDTLVYEGRIVLAQPGDRASAVAALAQLVALEGQSNHTRFDYDAAGRLVWQSDVGGLDTYFGYNRFGDLTYSSRQTTDGAWLSQQSHYYDRRGLRVGTDEYADSAQDRQTRVTYDAFGRVVSATDARGAVSEYAYDRRGRQISVTLRDVGGQDPTNQVAYDAFDRIVSRTDAMGRTTQYAYSDSARSTTVTSPEGVAVTMIHDAFGQQVETRQTLPDGSIAIQRWTYDNRGLLVRTTDALGHDTVQTYDARGQLLRTTDATGRSVAYTYDAAGRVLRRIEDPDGLQLTTRYTYDGAGRQLEVIDAAGRVTRMQYDRAGHLVELARDPDGLNLRTQYTWDAAGRQLSVTEGAGTPAARTTAYAYDGHGRRIAEILDPDGLALRTDYAYDTNDNLIARRGYGGEMRFVYDAANRLRFSVSASGGVVETRHDANGRVVAERAYARTLDLSAFPYDLPDEATFEALIAAQSLRDDARDTVGYSVYDNDGRLRLKINGAGEVVEVAYDAAGRMSAEKGYVQRLALTPTIRDALAAGALSASAVLAQLPTSVQGDAITRYFHDAAGRLIFTVNSLGGMTRMWYDAAGRIEKVRSYVKAANVATLATATIASLDAQIDSTFGFEGENRIYDSVGRLRYQISADGTLRETRYDAAGNVVVSLRYTQRALEMPDPDAPMAADDIPLVADLAAFTAANERYAAAEYSIHDAAGRLRLQMARIGDSGGLHREVITAAVVEREYDAAGRLVAVFAHTQSVSTGLNDALRDRLKQGLATVSDFATTLAGSRASAQVQRMVHDGAGREVYRVDGANGVLAMTYTAQGEVASTRRHAVMLPVGTAMTASAVGAALTASARDVVEFNVHDVAGRIRYRVAGDGSVEEMRYDGMGRLTATLRFAASIGSTLMAQVEAGTATESDFASFVAANETNARVSMLHYDAAGRVRFQTARSGANRVVVMGVEYDGLGREIASTTYGVEIAELSGADAATVEAALDAALGTDPVLRAARQRTTRSYHDSEGQVRFVLDASGALGEKRYDSLGREIETIAYGTRPPAGALADTASLAAWAATQPTTAMRRSLNTYDRAGQVIARTDALGFVEHYEYDTAGNITRHTDRTGAVWRYEYDLAGRRVAEISPPVSVTIANASVLGNATVTTTTRSITTRYVYDGLRNIVTRIEDADGSTSRTTRYEYDNRGHQVRILLPDPVTGDAPSAGARDTIEIRYDTLGLAVSEKDASGNVQYKVYDRLGRVLYDIDAELQVTSHQYNAFGEEVRAVRHATVLNAAAMQAAGWTPVNAPGEAQVLAGLVLSAQDRGVESRYTLLGQKEWVLQDAVTYVRRDGTVATGRPALRTTWDAYGELAKTSLLIEGVPGQPGAVWADTYHYRDALGRETVTVDAEGYVNEQQYNAYGDIWRKTEYARALSPATLASLTIGGQPPALPAAGDAVSGYDRSIEYTFDTLGRIATETVRRVVQISSTAAAQVVDATTQFGYDAEGRVTSTQDALGVTRTTYDALGRARTVQQPVRTVVVGDADTRLQQAANTLATASLYMHRSPYTTLQYDAFGNVSQVRQYANGRDGNNTPVADATNDRIMETRYDRRGRAIEERDVSSGNVVNRTYDASDRMVTATTVLRGGVDPLDTSKQIESDIVTRLTYDKTGRQLTSKTTRERYSLTSGVRGALVASYVDGSEALRYNAFGEIVAKDDRIDTAFAAGTPFAQFEYDNAGRMLRSNAQGGAWRDYGYDLAGRGVRMSVKSFTSNAAGVQQVVDGVSDSLLDKLGRVVQQTLPSNSNDLNQRPVVVREYDRWGNVTRMVDARGQETLYRYNDQNKLTLEIRPEVKVVNRDGTEVRQRPTTAYYYDVHGRLLETRDANGNSDRYVYDNVGRIVESIDALGNTTRTAYDIFDNDRYTQNALGYITGKQYDRAGRVLARGDFTFEAGSQTQRKWMKLEAYDLRRSGDRWATTVAPDDTTLNLTARYDYDTQNHVLASRSAAGMVKTYDYDLQGRKTRETNGNQDKWRYLLERQDVNGTISGESVLVYRPHYDDWAYSSTYSGQKIRKDREGEYVFDNEQTWDYDYFGRLIDHNDLGGADYDYIYHAVTGQLIRTTRATSTLMNVSLSVGTGIDTSVPTVDKVDGQAQTATQWPATVGTGDRVQIYYASGLVKEIREGENWTRYEYDANGNRTLEETYTRDGGGTIVHLRTITTYDSNNRVSLVKQYDILRDYTGADRPYELVTVRYSYDAVGNRRRVTTGISTVAQPYPMTGYATVNLTSSDYIRNYITSLAPETTFQVTATLTDGSPLPSWLTWNATTMTLQGTPSVAQSFTVRITAVSSEDQSVTVFDIPITILPSQPPRLNYVDSASWNVTIDPTQADWTFSTASAFMDPEGLPLHYSAQMRVGTSLLPLPAGMQINPTTGVISGVPADGAYQIVVTAYDADNQSVSKVLSLLVQSDPWTMTAYRGLDMDVGLWGVFGTHSGADPIGYSIVSVNNGAVPGWLQMSGAPGDDWWLTGTPTTLGIYNVVVRATYPDGTMAYKTLVLTVKKEPMVGSDPLSPSLERIGDDLSIAPSESAALDVVSGSTVDADSGIETQVTGDTGKLMLVAPIYDDGGSGGGGGGGGTGGVTLPTSPGAGYMYLPSNSWRSLWFDYDAENHVTIVNGRLVNGVIQIGVNGTNEKDLSYALHYDAAGRERVRIEKNGTGQKYQNLQYNERGQLHLTYGFASSEAASTIATERRTYDNAGRLQTRQELFNTPTDPVLHGQAAIQENYGYDADGRVAEIATLQGYSETRANGIDPRTGLYALVYQAYTQRTNSRTTYAYDLKRDGVLTTNVYQNYKDNNYTLIYSYSYMAAESYLETAVSGAGIVEPGSFPAKSTQSTYDAWGRRTKVQDGKDRLFAYDMTGNIVRRVDNGSYYSFATTRYAYANGQQVAATNGGWVDIVSHLTAYKNSEQGRGTTTVAAGETLRSIAMRIYGTDSLWYVLATANGLDGSEDLVAGMTLSVPDVKVNSNDANTFKPYNPGEIIGNTAPQLDYVPPPPPKKNCGQIILMIVAVVVAVVVTIFTAGVMAGPSAAGIGAIFSAGTAVLAGTAVTAAGVAMATGTMMAIAAVAGVAGALASELVLSLDKDHKFDWGAVALGGITSALSAGAGRILAGGKAGVETLAKLQAGKNVLTTANAGFFNANAWAKGAAMAVSNQVANYGANWALNRIDPSRDRSGEKFSWANLAGSAVSGAISGQMGEWLGGKKTIDPKSMTITSQVKQSGARLFFNDFVAGFSGSAIRHNVASLLGESGRPDYGQMAIDAFGNATANATIRGISNIAASVERNRAEEKNRKQIEFIEKANLDEIGVRTIKDGDRFVAEVDVKANSGKIISAKSEVALDQLIAISESLDASVERGELSAEDKIKEFKRIASNPAMVAMMQHAARAENPQLFKVSAPAASAPSIVVRGKVTPLVVTESEFKTLDVRALKVVESIYSGGELHNTLQEVVIRSQMVSDERASVQHVVNMIASGAEAILQFADDHEFIAAAAVAGVQAAITGGPIKTVLMGFVKNFAGEVVGNKLDEIQKTIEVGAEKKFLSWGWGETVSMVAASTIGLGFAFVTQGADEVFKSLRNLTDRMKGLAKNVRKHADDLDGGRMGLSAGVAGRPKSADTGSIDYAQKRDLWNRRIDFNGNQVYQRDDLINPELLDRKGRTNLERMQRGLAPIGPDGKPVNLHHNLQMQDGPISEMTETFHRQASKTMHINPNTIPSGIDRAEFAKWRKAYWKNRAGSFQ